jgi:outer membrane protein OmpA-like peptidoglycan-associated protein/tetratricopeptide (TPR) repeat protein
MKRFILLLFVNLIAFSGFSQKRDIPLKEYFADAEFFFVSEEYVDALQDYLEVSKRGYEDNANINYRIGICYLYIPEQKEKSIDYLLKASANASGKFTGSTLNEVFAPLDVFLYLGNAYRVTNNLEKAIETYNKYLSLIPEAAKEERSYTLKQIEACNIAREFMANPLNFEFKNLGSLINTNNANTNCVVSGDGSTMVYMTKLPFYDAVFMSQKRGNNWSRPINITPQIQSDGDQIITGISHDGKTILLVKEDVFDSEIYISYFEEGQWTKSKPIGKSINGRYYESHASFGNNDSTIFFASNRPGGIGEMDIYYSKKQAKDNWSEPVNIGDDVNTNLNEDSPFLTSDGKSLYFSSQGHLNMGGYDLFVAHLTDSGWSDPENLKYPISTSDDDLFFYPWDNGKTGYIQKILSDGLGSWDIYSIGEKAIEPVEEPIVQQVVEEPKEVVKETKQIEEPVKTIEFEVKPLLFGFDAYTITEEAKTEISKYISLLKSNKTLKLVITGHTDALGPDNYNLLLSERRASTIVKYIVSQGIPADRLKAVGMGEKLFIASNTNSDGSDNPEGRKFNRRVEFEITGIDESTIIIRRINIVPAELKIQEK